MPMEPDVYNNRHSHLSDEEVKKLIQASQNGDMESRNSLIRHNIRLVWSVVQRFLNRGYEAEDLFQIGCIGLLKAVDKFDLNYDVKFSTYAVPMIIGEIQRFLRDDGMVKVSRSLKEMANRIRKTKDHLSKKYGRLPTIQEIANEMGVDPEEIVFAQEANRAPASIHETVYENDGDPITLMDQIADEPVTTWFDKLAIKEAIHRLSDREKLIVYLRYYKDQTQSEVASRLGISQVQVSRLEKKIIAKMRQELDIQKENR
ncbi:RNA polymerase sporulation sigma factor SigF [Thermoactinomyces vulgaris]|uniref:RNA polymerase sigma factor n=2 Tax=Thermoactinomyces vulgaris TaxID=2026 RepID=A0ABS0QDU0_THEVU|nr:RNA polymerase sporulation sigma factor SigF [Thermoactinomyces vulgaris]MBA4595779.1 RNA polymerase sporulation sigma factor SigF [Thermoactinomyces vulgaris]MBH8587436.1 RNA polymerase sporulation sigma factor SigF [Thermoactinomyces vulgaris]